MHDQASAATYLTLIGNTTDAEFWAKFWLIVVDKGLLALILLLAGLYVNQYLEAFKGKLSRQQEHLRTTNQAVLDLTKKLTAGNHQICWLSWSATQADNSMDDDDFVAYDKVMIEVLSDLVGLQAALAALDPAKYDVLSKYADELTQMDVEVGLARELYRTQNAEKYAKSMAMLQALYKQSNAFDVSLLKAVTGLLRQHEPKR